MKMINLGDISLVKSIKNSILKKFIRFLRNELLSTTNADGTILVNANQRPLVNI